MPTMSLEEATRLVAENRWDEAAEALEAHAAQPDATNETLLMYARSLVGGARFSMAVWPLDRLVQRDDAPEVAHERFVRALLEGGAELEAIEHATITLDRNDELHRVRELRASANEKVLDYEAALEDLEILADELHDNSRILERVLNMLIKVEDWDGARERIAQLEAVLAGQDVKPGTRAVFCSTTAQFERDRGEVETAEKKLRECLEDTPSDITLIMTLTEILDGDERVDEATAFLEGKVETYPKRQRLRDRLAVRYASLGRNDEADALLVDTATQVNNTAAWMSLANLRLKANDIAGTIEALDRAVEVTLGQSVDDPALNWKRLNVTSRFSIGDVYVRAKNWDRAGRIIESLEDEEPAMALLLSARMNLDQGDPATALEEYEEAFKSFPSNPAARYLAGRAAIEVGDFDKAVNYYQDALRSDAGGSDAGLVLAQMLLAEGRQNYAIDTLSFFLVGSENEPHGIRLLANAGSSGNAFPFAEAMRKLLRANPAWSGVAVADQALDVAKQSGAEAAVTYIEESPEFDDPVQFEAFAAWVALARETDRKDVDAKIAAYIKKHADSAGAAVIDTRVRYEGGDLVGAIAAAERAIALNPLLPTAYAEYGQLLVEAERVDDALRAFDRATELDAFDARPWFSRVRALYDAERYAEAVESARELLIHHPWHGRAALILVDVQRDDPELVDEELAYMMAMRASRYIGVSGPRAILELARLDLARGNATEAEERYRILANSNFNVAASGLGLARALVAQGRSDEAAAALRKLMTAIADRESAETNDESEGEAPSVDQDALAEAKALLDELESGTS